MTFPFKSRAARCAVLGFALGASAAQAATTIDVAASASFVNGGTSGNDPVSTLPVSLSDAGPLAASVDTSLSGAGPYFFVRASADASGAMETSAGSAAQGIGTATATWHSNFDNLSGGTQSYAMNVLLSGGWFQLSGGAQYPARHFRAGFTADVSVNGSSVWSTGQTFSFLPASESLVVTKTGVDIGNATTTSYGDGIYRFDLADYAGSVNLGSFANGANVDVVYTITSVSRWDDARTCAGECAGVGAVMNDPFSIDGHGPRIQTAVLPAVPEPETAALMLAGLMALAATRRRARDSASRA